VKYLGTAADWNFRFSAPRLVWTRNVSNEYATIPDRTLDGDCINPVLWIFCTGWER